MAADLSELRSLFVDEAREYLEILNHGMLRLEAAPGDRATLNELFRAVHSLKGMAGTMGYTSLVELAHALESVLDGLRSGPSAALAPASADPLQPAGTAGASVHPELFDLLFASASAMEALVEQVAQSDSAEPDEQTRAAVESLVAALGRVVRAGSGGAAVPTASERRAPESLWFLEPEALEQVEKAVQAGRFAYVLEVVLAPDCVFKGVRAYAVLRALGEVGDVVGTWPSRASLDEERFDERFHVALVTDRSSAEVEKAALGVSEVREARAVRAELGVAVARQRDSVAPAPPAAPAGAPPDGRQPEAGSGAVGGQDASAAAAPAAPASRTEVGTPEPAAPSVPSGPAAVSRDGTIRVETARLDALVDLVGELVITTNQLQDAYSHRRLPEESQVNKLSRVTSDLQNAVMRLRMVPLRQVFGRFPRMVRDLARRSGKQVVFTIEGEQTELDRNIVNEIGEPLVHLIRNAVDHGIELPQERIAAGKPPAGRLRLAARHEGNHVVIEVEDDGAGISIERIRQKAVASGRMTPEQAQAASAEELVQLIFESGFSTARTVTDVSGRGIGMDAAKAVVESLGGRISVHTRAGRGSLFVIRLPLTLAIMRALLVESAGEMYALPSESVQSIERLPDHPELVHGRPVLRYRGRLIPLVSLRQKLSLAAACPDGQGDGEDALAVVLSSGRRVAAIAVDRVVGLQEVVIRNLSGWASLPGVAGATILGSGRVALILDVLWLV